MGLVAVSAEKQKTRSEKETIESTVATTLQLELLLSTPLRFTECPGHQPIARVRASAEGQGELTLNLG